MTTEDCDGRRFRHLKPGEKVNCWQWVAVLSFFKARYRLQRIRRIEYGEYALTTPGWRPTTPLRNRPRWTRRWTRFLSRVSQLAPNERAPAARPCPHVGKTNESWNASNSAQETFTAPPTCVRSDNHSIFLPTDDNNSGQLDKQ